MKRNIKSLIGFTMGATDGEIGKVTEFYFDDHTWTIRYLIVETGSWLNHRKVLIATEALVKPDWEHEIFPVNLTKDQIKNSPDIDTEQPVSRQHEIEMYDYYPWRTYWGSNYGIMGLGTSGMMMQVREPLEEAVHNANNKEAKDSSGDPHLRSTHKVKGYAIHATDGEIGDVEDFIIDDSSWKLDFLVVDTGSWFPRKKVLISPSLIEEIDWDSSTVVVSATEDEVKKSPEYNADQDVNEVYKKEIDNYYLGSKL
ncbi:PRC-barrel domain-containing protein [Flavobacterium cellulosilyticum]|uniref:PRC-barrel domain containing protein n=1 Tax=Flavobacterium cellulosilyticum TaxID=2541731 RepID=A0A4R5CGW2_9FLAO|nr:PRC-barrel domain-containing protein [Flavobacterium cellulosilyticum]TDD97523.1 PRC-barrel domain containing protein [Flavobacterium cellulosilyticum]